MKDAPPPHAARTWASDFERRHEERFKGVQFDWLEFQRDGAPFPVPDPIDPSVTPPQELVVTPAAGGPARTITHLGLRPAGVEWNAAGTALVFTADSGYRDERHYGADQVWVASLDGTTRRLTTDGAMDHSSPHFSPDGRWILYTRQLSTDARDRPAPRPRRGDRPRGPARGRRRRAAADGGLGPHPGKCALEPGRAVRLLHRGHRVAARTCSGSRRRAARWSRSRTGDRRLSAISFDRAMTRMAYVVGRVEAPPEVHVADIDGTHERRVTHVQRGLGLDGRR